MKAIHSHMTPLGEVSVYTEKPHFPFLHLMQTHSCLLLPEEVSHFGLLEGDGFLLEKKAQLPLSIKTADCMPILVIGNLGFTFLHAGWKGLANGILTQGVVKKLEPTYAYIGPSIRQDAFEVTEEFYQHFGSYSHRFMRKDGKHFFDLQNTARDMLRRLNPQMIVEDSGVCTYHNKIFNSYRRDHNQERNWNILQFS
ncbi:MAG: polyphenol oxidase family protein [Bacteriovoracaceae bacterium]